MIKTSPNRKILFWAILAFAAAGLLPFIPQFHGASQDEGLLLYNSQRILQGQTAYRDFFSHYPPLTLWLAALWFKMFGATIWAARGLMVLIGTACAALVYCISRRLLKENSAFLPPLLFICAGVNCWPVVSHHWNGVLCLLSAFLVFLEYQRRKSRVWLYGTGFLTGITFFMMQTEGLALGIALTLYLLFTEAGNLPGYFLGILTAALPVLGILAAQDALAPYLYQNFLWAREFAIPFNRAPYTLSYLINDWNALTAQLLNLRAFTPDTPAWFFNALSYWLVEAVKYGLFYPVLALSIYLALRGRELPAGFRPLVLLLTVWCAFSFYRQDLLYLNYHTPVFYLLLIFLLSRLRPGAAKAWGAGLLAVFLIYNGFLLQSCREYRYPLAFPRGRMLTREPAYSRQMNELLTFLEKNTQNGETVFTFPNAASFYFLTGRKNPTAYNTLYPLMFPRGAMLEAKEQIERDRTRFLFLFKISPDALQAYPLVKPEAYFREDEFMQRTILSGYALVRDFGPCVVYEREKPLNPAVPAKDGR